MPKTKDHRQIGREMDLFSFHDVAPGAIFWHPKGWQVYSALKEFIREEIGGEGYQEISTPVMVKKDLFKKSGHWEHFKENIFTLKVEDQTYALKPMNCPEACLVYGTKTRSYQDLPIKLSEFGILHRQELSGTLGGLFRVRQFVIDDAHLFVRPDQIQEDIHKLIKLVSGFYSSLDFTPRFYLATKPDKAMGDPKLWKEAEKDLEQALKVQKQSYEVKPKDGAFYGPKIDIHIKDSQNRDWQLATIQLDFQMPERLGLTYVDKDGKEKRPIMIHRAVFGSFERFLGILIEHYQGAFPAWLSPVQCLIIPITEGQNAYGQEIHKQLKDAGVRVELDSKNETMQAKIRDAQIQKIPYMLIIGEREEKNGTASLRLRDGKDLGEKKIDEIVDKIKKTVLDRSGELW